ncbi:RNA polymerase sigma-70 factor [Chitinophaga barathri]|uniref:RNA polymerase sigma-70 factor n=1 Tax=Chitinophaga barathri TaxID=1647451 RepID=A0A3N4MG87_9BACT|nr:RNA polymerase sigma-70 factor [Chitinophaga barathri]RPD43042.1 RNA polymerase sigma-70 factor [Chitinophaga barathri]
MQPDELSHLQDLIAQHNERAYRRLFDYFYPKLKSFVITLIKDEMGAEEIVEDVFVAVWNQRARLPEIRSISVYLFTAVKKRSLTFLASKSKDLLSLVDEYPEGLNTNDFNPEMLLMGREMAERISAAIQLLPPKCRLIYTMVRDNQLKYREVAEILNISEHTVDAQMTIAIKRIAKFIRDYLASHPGQKK